jgi:hypothetical protein
MPFRFVENPEWRLCFDILRPGVDIPHRTTIRSDLETQYTDIQDRMFEDLPPESKVSIALDGWQSPFKVSFLAITAYYITSDWKWREVLIGFEHLKGEHTGSAMADIVVNILHRFKLAGRLYCITTDNAASNGTLRRNLEDMLERLDLAYWDHKATKIPCMPHVLQLVVKAMLRVLNVKLGERGMKKGNKEQEEEEEDEDKEEDKEEDEDKDEEDEDEGDDEEDREEEPFRIVDNRTLCGAIKKVSLVSRVTVNSNANLLLSSDPKTKYLCKSVKPKSRTFSA